MHAVYLYGEYIWVKIFPFLAPLGELYKRVGLQRCYLRFTELVIIYNGSTSHVIRPHDTITRASLTNAKTVKIVLFEIEKERKKRENFRHPTITIFDKKSVICGKCLMIFPAQPPFSLKGRHTIIYASLLSREIHKDVKCF